MIGEMPKKIPHRPAKDGIPDIDGHGDAGQVDRPGAAAENRTENGRPDLGHLRQEQGKEQDQEMAQLK